MSLSTRFTYLCLLLSSLILLGCEGGIRGMSNQELAAKREACIQGNPTSPGKVTACENIRKECERRRKEGNFAC
ncbi:hypothetical protein [Teredinibacter sp. KSP-S5-2]|uniref:hypothetical protein n=1 Tax=Teredinibacter sp. KSP-S5-2 TaxID=3034506 RepID=UPI002934F274|nr:hypothetical protein [Teredinibacter sp. KSP-S5-2]WNO09076.1 hypothetical protein P5V12_19210 [Teredinibacter sp. KSP-S5-2]